MKEKVSIFRNLLLVLITSLAIVSCQKDKTTATDDLIGTWTAGTATVDALVSGKPITQYFTDLGYANTDAQTYANLFNFTVQQAFTGTVTFKSDNTYSTNLGGKNDSGTWSLSPDARQLTLNSTNNTPLVLNIESLTKNQLVVNWAESDSADINGDKTPEAITVNIKMTLTK